MADNTTLNAGSGGDVIATDDIGGVKHQQVKIEWGTDGTATPVASGASAIPIQDGGNSITIDGTVSVSGQITAGTAGTASTDVVSVQGITGMTAVKVDGSAVTQPVSGTVSITANSAVNIAQMNGVATTMGNGASGTGVQRVTIASDSTGILAAVTNVATIGTSVTPGTSAAHLGKAEDAAHTTGDTGVMALGVRAASPTDRSAGPTDGDYEPFALNEVGAIWMTPTGSANGGLSIGKVLDSDETEDDIKTAAGTLYGWWIFNSAASTRYVKFYNATAASVTVGTTTPVLTLPVPAGAAANLLSPIGIAFSTAISVATTTGLADNDTGAPGANEVTVMAFYK